MVLDTFPSFLNILSFLLLSIIFPFREMVLDIYLSLFSLFYLNFFPFLNILSFSPAVQNYFPFRDLVLDILPFPSLSKLFPLSENLFFSPYVQKYFTYRGIVLYILPFSLSFSTFPFNILSFSPSPPDSFLPIRFIFMFSSFASHTVSNCKK